MPIWLPINRNRIMFLFLYRMNMTATTSTEKTSPAPTVVKAEELGRLVGRRVFRSEWTTFSQQEAAAFSHISRDPDPMHVDPEWAGEHSPYGRTVLAGLNILSLLPSLVRGGGFEIEGPSLIMNYGFDRVRFVDPVPVDAPFRNTVVVKSVETRPDGKIKLITTNTIEVRGADRPAMIADWINLLWP